MPIDETARLAKAEDRIHSVEADLAKAKLEWVKLVRGAGDLSRRQGTGRNSPRRSQIALRLQNERASERSESKQYGGSTAPGATCRNMTSV